MPPELNILAYLADVCATEELSYPLPQTCLFSRVRRTRIAYCRTRGASATPRDPDCPTCAHLRAAAIAIVGSEGLTALTFERICRQAGLTVDQVDAHYPTAFACLHDAYDALARSIQDDFARVFAAEPAWGEALRLAAHNLLGRMANQPHEARFYFVEVLRGDHELLRRREAARCRLIALFERELSRRRGDVPRSRMQVELLIGSAFQAIAAAVERDGPDELPALGPELEQRAFVFEPVAV